MNGKQRKLWAGACKVLGKFGVTTTFTELRDICLFWSTTRHVTAGQVACRYLLELDELVEMSLPASRRSVGKHG